MPCSPPPRTPMPPMPTRSRKSRRASRPVWSTRPRDAASIRAAHASFRVYAMKKEPMNSNRSRIISSPAGYIKDEEHAPLSDVGPGPVIFGCGPALFDGRQNCSNRPSHWSSSHPAHQHLVSHWAWWGFLNGRERDPEKSIERFILRYEIRCYEHVSSEYK